MDEIVQELRHRLVTALRRSGYSEGTATEIAFHMTDWLEDLERIRNLYNQHSRIGDDETVSIIIEFLAHVPNHLAAAKKLAGCGPIEDIFGVGVLEEDKE